MIAKAAGSFLRALWWFALPKFTRAWEPTLFMESFHSSSRKKAKEKRTLVKWPDRFAALASAPTQVRARAVLPGSSSSEPQATGALPPSA